MSKSIVVAVAILATVCFCNVSATFVIKSMQDFLEFNKRVINESTEETVLETDLDFSSTSFPLPLGVDDEGKCHFYWAKFNGNGHVIKNLKIDGTKSKFGSAALFCGVHSKLISNFTIDKSCEFIGDIAAGVAVSATYNDFLDIKVYATISGKSIASAFIGKIDGSLPSNFPVGSIKNCKGDTKITVSQKNGNSYIGGFIGLVNDTYSPIYGFKMTYENNVGDFTFVSEYGNTIFGCLVGSIERSRTIQFEFFRNQFNINSASDTKLPLTLGGLYGRMVDVPVYKVTMKDNVIFQTQGVN